MAVTHVRDDPTQLVAASRPAHRKPPSRPRRRKRPGFARRCGPFLGVTLAGALAVVVAFVATVVYANIDASRSVGDSSAGVRSESVRVTPAISDGRTATTLPENLSPEELASKIETSVRTVRTRDESGQPVEGTAFVVGSFGGQTLLLTSFAVVRANTKAPGPGITLGESRQATLWTWQEDRDLALLVTGGNIESLPWAEAVPNPNEQLWVGAAGQKPSIGITVAASTIGIDHNIFIDDIRQGAPLVNRRGEVVGMASKVYNPTGTGTDTRFTAVPIRVACERVLRCGSGNTTADGAGSGGAGGAAASTTTTPRPTAPPP